MEQLNFTKFNYIFEIIIYKYKFGLMIDGKRVWLQEEVRKEDISIALMIRERFSTSVLFEGHSGSNLIDPTLQDNVVIGTGIFPYV